MLEEGSVEGSSCCLRADGKECGSIPSKGGELPYTSDICCESLPDVAPLSLFVSALVSLSIVADGVELPAVRRNQRETLPLSWRSEDAGAGFFRLLTAESFLRIFWDIHSFWHSL